MENETRIDYEQMCKALLAENKRLNRGLNNAISYLMGAYLEFDPEHEYEVSDFGYMDWKEELLNE